MVQHANHVLMQGGIGTSSRTFPISVTQIRDAAVVSVNHFTFIYVFSAGAHKVFLARKNTSDLFAIKPMNKANALFKKALRRPAASATCSHTVEDTASSGSTTPSRTPTRSTCAVFCPSKDLDALIPASVH